MKFIRNIFVWHPFLAGLFPVVFLYSRNVTEMRLAEIFPPLAIITVGIALLILLLKPFIRDRYRRGLFVTTFVILFFSYGPISTQLGLVVSRAGEPTAFGLWLVPVTLLFLITLVVWWLIRTQRNLSRVSQLFNQVLAVLLLIQIGIAGYGLVQRGEGVTTGDNPTPLLVTSGHSPDIYLIILDGYARSDILSQLYETDNSEFLQALETRGFYVADSSHSNYGSTAQSLTSLLNMSYLHRFMNTDRRTFSRMPTAIMLDNNRVLAFLKKHGYQTVTFASGYAPTEIEGADYYFSPALTLSEFQNHLLNSTPIPLLVSPFLSQFDLHRQRLRFILEKLPQLEDIPTPKFVFAHITCPHPPFVFTEDGTPFDRNWPFSFSDGDHYFNSGGSLESYRHGYRGQIRFISREILIVIDAILKTSKEPPVIILQGDHGPGSGLHWESLEETDIKERFSILNAYLLPGIDHGILYKSISPVNSFRVVLNGYFGTSYELLPDSNYFTTWTRPYDFFDVTAKLQSAPPQ